MVFHFKKSTPNKDQMMITFLGKDTKFEGKLKFHGNLRIDGHFKGEIESDGNLIIGEDGMLEANVHTAYISIRGEVYGNIHADQRVDIRAPGKVFGNVMSPTVVIDEGVIFEGQTRMYHAKDAAEKKPVVIGVNEYTGGPPPNLTAIYGFVLDQQTGKPVRNAEIICKGQDKKETQANSSGYYEIINVKDGLWIMKIKARGYKTVKTKVEVIAGGTYKQVFNLEPRKKIPEENLVPAE
ncbi:MAG: hypothetical protein EHM45_05575 [Desulfobacteraceae bacterium]|nr:MAG: hypothetical protein EHM45_05575 [Desulfobacteraceae bacterium]